MVRIMYRSGDSCPFIDCYLSELALNNPAQCDGLVKPMEVQYKEVQTRIVNRIDSSEKKY